VPGLCRARRGCHIGVVWAWHAYEILSFPTI
jgi:hypothetical protein